MVTNAGGSCEHCRESGRDPLARGPHPRRLGPILLHPRSAYRRLSGRPAINRSGRDADEYEVVYSTDKAEFRRVDGDIETHMEVTVVAGERSPRCAASR